MRSSLLCPFSCSLRTLPPSYLYEVFMRSYSTLLTFSFQLYWYCNLEGMLLFTRTRIQDVLLVWLRFVK
uniref:Uncharacterized protein n=1 Tax=Rhizophora mucronata TaxID=61149 RepID=A0A2P2PVL7_RHIMU